MPEPTYDDLLKQVAFLQSQLLQQPRPQPVGTGNSTEQTVVTETPEQVTLTTTQGAPDEASLQRAGQALQQAAFGSPNVLARALLPRSKRGKSTPEEILAQMAALKSVIISGVNSAGYGDKRTEFRSLAELRQILNGLQEELEELLGTGGRVRQIRMTTQADKAL